MKSCIRAQKIPFEVAADVASFMLRCVPSTSNCLSVQMSCTLYGSDWCLQTPKKSLSLGLDNRNMPIANLPVSVIWRKVQLKGHNCHGMN